MKVADLSGGHQIVFVRKNYCFKTRASLMDSVR